MRIIPIICVLPLLGLSACTYLAGKLGGLHPSSKKLQTDSRIREAKVIGVIELVNPEQNYVLINCEQRLNIPVGTEIVSQGVGDSRAKLKVTPERKGNYITADITEGMPQLRDLVLYKITPGEVPAPPPVTTTASGAVVPLTPVMQADVIPPLDAPFQPIAPAKAAAMPAPPPTQQQPQAPPPAEAPTTEPAADPSKLPPVIR